MPCTICKVLVQVGQSVRNDDILFISEAMKMELEIRAGVEGVETEILTKKGTSVENGQKLAQIRVESQCK
ncbi:acetyl-CoA carboxylase biotin carboxyl carrier protein subunit [Ruminococcus sp.]